MTRGLLPPELEREVERLKIRVSDLERQLRTLIEQRPPETIFSIAGALYATASNRWYPRADEKVIEILVSLVAAGDTATVVRILKNDDEVRPIEIPAGQGADSPVVVNAAIDLQRNSDDLRVEVVEAGDNAEGLNVQARMR